MPAINRKNLFVYLPLLVIVGLLAAAAAEFSSNAVLASLILRVTLAVGTIPLLVRIAASLMRGHLGIDLIAILAIAGAWFLHENLAGTIILLMLSGGEALEEYANGRSRRELDALLARAPSQTHKKDGQRVIDVSVETIRPEDVVIVKPGELIPVDGLVVAGNSEVDESALTGEALPVSKHNHSMVMSGSLNKDRPLEIRALRTSKDSKYEQIIRLVRDAERARAPIVRIADQYSVWFTAVTIGLAAGAWLLSRDPIRALAVLVVATPCPLILATPIAIVSGMSKAAARGIIIKTGNALEKLGQARSFAFDKTGTLTLGKPEVAAIKGFGITEKEVGSIAASLDQLSTHILAQALLNYAEKSQYPLAYPDNFQEFFGEGVAGQINGQSYFLGRLSFLAGRGIQISEAVLAEHEKFQQLGVSTVYLADSQKLLGELQFSDVIRADTVSLFQILKKMGIKKIVMLTGDKYSVASKVAAAIGIGEFRAELLPDQKVQAVKQLQKNFAPLAMVGDGINDAPALATAEVGIALGAHGATASAESGDIVIMLDTLNRVGEAFAISRYAIKIAKQSIAVGIGLSIGLMIIAALGYIRPVYGALLQEIIDVLVIFNALRVNRMNPKIAETKSPEP